MARDATERDEVNRLLREVLTQFPDAVVQAEHVRLDGDPIVFRATIERPGAGRVSRYGTAPASAPDAIAVAETAALRNVLRTLGYDLPAAVAPPAPSAAAKPAPHAKVMSVEANDADLLDTSWTKFWEWAHTVGLRSKKEIEARLGEPVDALTPGQIRERLIARGT